MWLALIDSKSDRETGRPALQARQLEMQRMEEDDSCHSTVSRRELHTSSTSKHRSNSTVATVESDWGTYLSDDAITVSLSPWSLYQAIRNARIITVEPVVFLYFFGVYLTNPLFQQYYLKRYSLDALRNTSYPYALGSANGTRCISKDNVNYYSESNSTYSVVENDATLIYMIRALVSTTMAIVTTLMMGPLSDQYGRRVVIVLVALGTLLQGLGSLAIVYFSLNLHYFVVIGAIEGVFGNFASLLMSSFSYVSDISSGKWRTMRIGIAESMVFLGGLLALEIGAFWFQERNCDMTYPLYLYVACSVAIVAYTVLFLPESLTREERRRKSANKPSGIKALIRGVRIFFCYVKEYPVWKLWVALVAVGIMMAIVIAEALVNTFYLVDLNWSPKKMGNFQAVSTGSHMISLLFVLPVLVALKIPDPMISLFGLIASISMNLLIGLSRSTYLLFTGELMQPCVLYWLIHDSHYAAGTFLGLEILMITSLRGYMSKIVYAEDQGISYYYCTSTPEWVQGLPALMGPAGSVSYCLPNRCARGV